MNAATPARARDPAATISLPTAKPIFSYKKYWAHRFGTAPFLPMSRAEMDELGWDACDIVLVTGDAYVDHPSFGMAIIGRLLEAQGFRVGIIAQPDWQSAEPFKALGKPAVFFGVTGGNMDSMVNRYTADRRLRHDDAYTPGGEGGKRPDRCIIVYAQRCREAFKDVPIVLGGIEASLRRIAHYDYWSDKVRRSVLADAKARPAALRQCRARGRRGGAPARRRRRRRSSLDDIRGVALFKTRCPRAGPKCSADDLDDRATRARASAGDKVVVRLPAFEQVEQDHEAYARASRVLHRESNPGNARPLVQTPRRPRPVADAAADPADHAGDGRASTSCPMRARRIRPMARPRFPAWDMIKFSVTIMRGCFGGCTFCSITEHEGRIIQNRSEGSILQEIETHPRQDAGLHRRHLRHRRADRQHVPDGVQGSADRGARAGGRPASIPASARTSTPATTR